MPSARENPDRNFSADGTPEGVKSRKQAGRRKIVAKRFRVFFASLVAQLATGSAQLWDKATTKTRE
jgi:hypothetical protein